MTNIFNNGVGRAMVAIRDAKALVAKHEEKARDLADQDSKLNRDLGAMALDAADDATATENLEKKVAASKNSITVNDRALEEARRRLLEADQRLHAEMGAQRVHVTKKQLRKLDKHLGNLEGYIGGFAREFGHVCRLAQDIGIQVSGMTIRHVDSGMSPEEVAKFVSRELARAYPAPPLSNIIPIPGAVTTHTGDTTKFDSLRQEYKRRFAYLIALVKAGPSGPRPAAPEVSVPVVETPAPPPVVLNAEVPEPTGPTVNLATATAQMALQRVNLNEYL
jgi:hypothetical protein